MTKLDFLVAVRDRYGCNGSVCSVTATASYCSVSPAACSGRYGGRDSFAIMFSLGLMCNCETVTHCHINCIKLGWPFPVKEEGCLRPSTSLLVPAGEGMAIQPRSHLFRGHSLDTQSAISWLQIGCSWCEGGAGMCGIAYMQDFCQMIFLDTQLMSLSTSLVPLSCTVLWSAYVLGKKDT